MARDDLVAACERAAGSGEAHEAAIRRTLLIAGVVTPDDVEGPDAAIAFRVRRERHRLRLEVALPNGHERPAAITKSAAEAHRVFDPYTKVIDVVTRPT